LTVRFERCFVTRARGGLEAAFPFGDLDWPRRVVPGPDPFIEEECDRLLESFSRKRWRVGRYQGRYQARAHFPYLAFLFTLFYTGMRPSEAVALRVRSLDLGSGTLFVERSQRSLLRQRQRPPLLREW